LDVIDRSRYASSLFLSGPRLDGGCNGDAVRKPRKTLQIVRIEASTVVDTVDARLRPRCVIGDEAQGPIDTERMTPTTL
jgi:hypothetical protein